MKLQATSTKAHYRPLLTGAGFSALIPSSQGTYTPAGEGYTNLSIKLMDSTAKTYSHQAAGIAPKLQGESLEATCRNIQHFLYNHFQYKADTHTQLLRTLSRAWADRNDGIDCKSYSLIASQILLQLGIKHYFRKIKQANNGTKPAGYETEWSHVYVVVPHNQINGSLNGGYYVIDGVIDLNTEPDFINKKDHYMNPHAVLNGISQGGEMPEINIIAAQPLADTDGLVNLTIATPTGAKNISATPAQINDLAATGKCMVSDQAAGVLGCVMEEFANSPAKKTSAQTVTVTKTMATPDIGNNGGGALAPTMDVETKKSTSIEVPESANGSKTTKRNVALIFIVAGVATGSLLFAGSSKKSKAKAV